MTWPIFSTAIVVVALALALGWYERSRPSARVVALVATMAALAVIGRIAFAPIPNVKPTTDLVLLAGLAFGAAPGFAVGATTALVSNLFFGQGLHTPWQMLAWGGVGLLGALVGRLLGDRPGPIPLALVCAAAGLGFGAVMDLSIWATIGGQHGLAEYLAIAVRSLPFNLAHAAGNAVFALVFGSVVLAALGRARVRAQVTIHPLSEAPAPAAAAAAVPRSHAPTLASVVIALLAAATVLAAAPPRASAASSPVSYLLSKQTSNGGFGDAGTAGGLESGWAAMALGASPGVPATARQQATEYLRKSAVGVSDPAELQRMILGLRALGASATDAGGRDLVAALLTKQSSDGSFSGLVNQTAFGILALRSAGRSAGSQPVKQAAAYLLGKAGEDGGFNFSGRGNSSVDDTAGVLQALVAAGRRGSPVTKAGLRFLRAEQLSDGGFPIGSDTRSNAQSTAWAVQALIALRRDPAKLRSGGRSPLQFLRSLQVDDGHIRYSRTSDQTPVWATAQAQLALAGTAMPVRRVATTSAAPSRTSASRAQRQGRRATRAARRAAERTRQAEQFTTEVLVPAAGAVVLLGVVFALR